MKCAPVIIPTLNRYEHLVRCVESLRRNTLASETELYISLDYPPAEKYRAGWEKIKAYLENGIEGFKECHFLYQTENLGAYANTIMLRNLIADEERHDAYIFTEDDNEFSPCFLDYINKGLEAYADDDRVAMITGYKAPEETIDGNCVGVFTIWRPWGFGTWTKTDKAIRSRISRESFDKLLHDGKLCRQLYKTSPNSLRDLFEACLGDRNDLSGEAKVYLLPNNEISPMERTYRTIMAIEGKCAIIPAENMVRNWGFDGSGTVQVNESFQKVEISDKTVFEGEFDKNIDNIPRIQNKLVPDKKGKRARVLRIVYICFGRKITKGIMNLDFRISHNWWRLKNKLFK